MIKSKEKKTKNGFLPVGHLDDQGDLEVPKIQIGFKRLSQKKKYEKHNLGTSLCASISANISIALTINQGLQIASFLTVFKFRMNKHMHW